MRLTGDLHSIIQEGYSVRMLSVCDCLEFTELNVLAREEDKRGQLISDKHCCAVPGPCPEILKTGQVR